MFGPNARAVCGDRLYFHHREPAYRSLLIRVVNLFRAQFDIPNYYDICVLTGSGTLANEAVLASLRTSLTFHSAGGEFTQRLRRLAAAHSRQEVLPSSPDQSWAMVAYETGESRVCPVEWPVMFGDLESGIRFADCVSSFPYYRIPRGADVFTTVTSKLLGGLPVLSLVGVKQSAWKWFLPADQVYSYLSLRRYEESYRTKFESPHTPAIALLYDFYERLQQFELLDLVTKINDRRKKLEQVFNPDDVIGIGPVFTVKPEAIPLPLATKWDLYRSAHGWQFFLYSGTDEQYDEFLNDLWKVPVHEDTRVS